MEVDARSILHMVLETTTHTAPEAILLGRIKTISTCPQWSEVTNHTCLRILLTEDVIIERTLVVIGYLAAWIPREEMVGEFHEIEGAAVLTVIA